MPPTIHTATPADAEAVANLQYRSHTISFAEFARPEWVATRNLDDYLKTWKKALENNSETECTFVARDNRKVVGIVSIRAPGSPGSPADLYGMHVDPDSRGQGIGQLLMSAAKKYIADQGFPKTDLGCLESNTYARNFYEKSGFRPVRYSHEEPYGWTYVMRFQLPPT